MRQMDYYIKRRKEKEEAGLGPTFRTGIDEQGSRLKGWDRYPGLSNLPDGIRWTLESYDVDDADTALWPAGKDDLKARGLPLPAEDEVGYYRELKRGSFAFVRPTGVGVVSMWRKDETGNEVLLGQDEALKLAHLVIDKWDWKSGSKGQKRIPRYLRPSYAFGVFDKQDFPTYTFEGRDEDWDAMMLMTRDAFNLVTAHLPEKTRNAYAQQGRFEITMQSDEGQWKGHARVVKDIQSVLPDAPQGTRMAVQKDSWKHETHGVYDDPNSLFIDVRPKKFHTGIDMDVQSWTNLGRYVLPNAVYQRWTRQKNDEFIAKLQRGLTPDEAKNLVFGGVDSDEQLESRLNMPLYEYIASGGDIRNSPHMLREYGQMYLKGLQKDFGSNRLYIPDSFSGYMTSAATYGKKILEGENALKPGEVFLDPRYGSIVYHPDDTKQVLKAAGGADYDDRQAGFVFKHGEQYKVLMWRSPNEPGEYALFNLKNPTILDKLGIKPVEGVDLAGLQKIPDITQKTYDREEVVPQNREPAKSYLEFLRSLAARIDKYALGSYLKTMRIQTGILGRGDEHLPFTTEYVTDKAQKFMEDMSDVKAETSRVGALLGRYPIPYSYWAGLKGRLPKAQRQLGYIPMPTTQQVAEMDDWQQQEFERVNAAVEAMANIATHPTELVGIARGRGSLTGKELKEKATGAYFGVLRTARKARGAKNDDMDYEIAGQTLQEHLLGLSEEDRDQTLAQLLVSTETDKYAETMLDDSIAWKRGKEFDISRLTMDFLRRKGLLNPQPDMNNELIGLDYPPPTTPALNLIVNPAKADIDPRRLVGLNISFGRDVDPETGERRRTVLGSTTLKDGTPWQGLMGTTVASQAALENVEGTVLSAVQKDRQIILTLARRGMQLAEPKAGYTAQTSPAADNPHEAAILSDLKVSAQRYNEGQLNLADLSPQGQYAVQVAAAQLAGRAAPRRNQLARLYYDPDARDVRPRVLGSRDMPWLLPTSQDYRTKEGKFQGRPELEAEGIETTLDAVVAGKRQKSTGYGEDARAMLFMRPGDYAILPQRGLGRAALVQIAPNPNAAELWRQQGLEWRGEAAVPMSGRQLAEKKDRWSLLEGWAEWRAMFRHKIDAAIRFNEKKGVKEGNLGWQEELGLPENERTADISWHVNYRLVKAFGEDDREKISQLLAGRLRAEAPPSGYFALPFTPQHLGAGEVDTYQEGNSTYYRPHRPADMSSAEYDARLTETARMAARGIFNADPVQRRGWRGQFARWHFGGGPNNIDSFQAWHDQLDPHSMAEFERSYLGMYGEYLVHKSEGWIFDQLSNTVWAKYWNRFARRYNLGRWPNTYMGALAGLEWLDLHGAGAAPAGPAAGTNRAAEPAAPYHAAPPFDGTPPPPEPPPGYYENYPFPPPGAGFTPSMPEPPPGFDPAEPPLGHEPEQEPQLEYPWRAVFGWKKPVDADHPFKAIFDRQEANKLRLAEAVEQGRNVGVFMPTGTGKTEFIKAMAATLGGINILITPLSSLNKQQAARLVDETTPKDREGNPVGPNLHNAFYLPGNPGYGHDLSEYKRAQNEALRAIAAGFKKNERGDFELDEHGRPIWMEPTNPITLVMSPEKFVALQESSLGRTLWGNVRSVTLDEAQEFAKHVGREMMTDVKRGIDWIKGDRERMPVLLTGGTVSNYQEQALREEFNLGEVIREYTDLPHINFRLHVAGRTSEHMDAALQAIERAEEGGRKALVYAYSTSEVEKIVEEVNGRALRKPADAINQPGDRMFGFHKGKGQRGRVMTDEELDAVQSQFTAGRLQQHLASSSAGGMGIDLKGLRDVVNIGPADISDLVQRMGRIRPGEKDELGRYGGTFTMVATTWQYHKWGEEILKNTSELATSPSMIAAAYEHVKRVDFSRNWKEQSDAIAKEIGKYISREFGVNENRGADVYSVLRQVGAISMDYQRMDDGNSYPIAIFNDRADLLGEMINGGYKNPYRPNERLSYAQYWAAIGSHKSGEFFAIEKLMDRLAPLSRIDPEEAGKYMKEGLLAAYSARPRAEAPKPGHEGLAVKVLSGRGDEFRVYENIFTGPESGEISITTYARAFGAAMRSGGSIIGSWHSQPAGRSAQASETDRSGLGTLGAMEIQEGENFVQRMRAEAPPMDQTVGPQPGVGPQQPPQPQQPLRTPAEELNAYTEHSLNGRYLNEALGRLTKAAAEAAERIEQQTDATRRQTEMQREQIKLGQEAARQANRYSLDMGTIGQGMAERGQQIEGVDPVAAQLLNLGGASTMAASGQIFDESTRTAAEQIRSTYKSGEGGYQGGKDGKGGGGWRGQSGMFRLSGVLSAMRAWRYIADPVLQEAYSGTTDYLDIAAAGGAAESRGDTVSGFRTRMAIAQEWKGRGAYEAFGGFLDLGYALSGSGTAAARMAAGARMGFGLAASGSEIGFQMYQNAYFMPKEMAGRDELMAVGEKVWKGSMVAGGMLTIGSLAQEPFQGFVSQALSGMTGTNLGQVPQEGYGSQLARGIVGGFADAYALGKAGYIGGVNPLATGWNSMRALFMEVAGGIFPGAGPATRRLIQSEVGLDKEAYKGLGFSEQMANYLTYGGDSENVKKYMKDAESLATTLGGAPEQYVGSIARSVASLGLTSEQAASFLSNAGRLGITADQWSNAIEGIGQQMGYLPGTVSVANFAMSMQGLDMAGLSQMQNQASRFAQFSSQLAPYMGYTGAAAAVRRYSLDRPGELEITQQAQALFDRWGGDNQAVVDQDKMFVVGKTGTEKVITGYKTIGRPDPDANQVDLSTLSVDFKTGEISAKTKDGEEVYQNSIFDSWHYRGGGLHQPIYEERDTYGPVLQTKEITAGDKIAEWAGKWQGLKGSSFLQDIMGISNTFMMAGMDLSDLQPMNEALTQYFSKLTPKQMQLTGQILGGDMGAMSYAAWHAPALLNNVGFNVAGSTWSDMAGRPIVQSSGALFRQLSAGQYAMGNPYGRQTPAGLTGAEAARSFLSSASGQDFSGVSPEMLGAWDQQGTQGLDWLMFNKQWKWTQASLGMAQEQLTGSIAFTRQMWGYQDQMNQLQYRSQMADFRSQRERMELTHSFDLQQDSLTLERMGKGNEYNRWNLQFNQQTSLMQRGWAREDFQYQDTMRGLQFGWNMEDLSEAIRFSTGRERRKLIRQRDRAATTHNLEEEQVDTQRERQEQMWAREDERYKKLLQYTEDMIKLDLRSFELNKSQRDQLYAMDKENLERHIQEYQQQFDLQRQMEEAQRNYQEIQWDFQQRQLDLQKEQAQAQHDYELIMKSTVQDQEKLMGFWKQIAEYEPAKLMKPLIDLMVAAGSLDKTKAEKLIQAIGAIGSVDPTRMQALINALEDATN